VEHLKEDFDFHIRWKPFLLNKQIPIPEEEMPLRDYLQMKFGEGAAEHFLSGQSPIAQHGKAVGITFNPSRLVVPTKKAHILLEHAAREGKQHEMQEILFRSYFSEGKNVNSEPVLRALLEEVGLDPDKALASLQDKEAVQHFEEGIREALRKGRCRNLSGFDYRMSSGNVSRLCPGISAVPHFEISLKENPHIKQQFSGAQPVDTFVSVFSRLKVLSKV